MRPRIAVQFLAQVFKICTYYFFEEDKATAPPFSALALAELFVEVLAEMLVTGVTASGLCALARIKAAPAKAISKPKMSNPAPILMIVFMMSLFQIFLKLVLPKVCARLL